MKKHDVIQNTPEWDRLRAGKATASAFDKIITAVKGEPSKQAAAYSDRLAAEIITGNPIDDFKGNAYTDRGHELEPDAIKAYAMLRDGAHVSHGGFVTNDDETYGASPDNFVDIANEDGELSEEGLLEIKCLWPENHVRALLNPGVEREYWVQLQGQLLVTGRKWVDIMFYHPEIRPAIYRVERDEEYIAKLQHALNVFVEEVKRKVAAIRGT